jgi:hypothetical protein
MRRVFGSAEDCRIKSGNDEEEPIAAKPQIDREDPTVASSQVIAELKTLRSQVDDLRRQNDGWRAAQSNLLAIGESPVGEKIIVDASPAYLMDLYQDKMSSEGDRLFAPYAGKWTNLTETVSDVSGNLVTAFEKAPNGAYRTINMFFDTESSDRLAVLTRDQKISVSCQIWFARDTNLRLRHCEFASK